MDYNRRYVMHCPRCRNEFIWDMEPLYMQIREKRIELNTLRVKVEQYNGILGKEDKCAHYKQRASEVAGELADLKSILLANERVNEVGINREFRQAVKEEYGEEEYTRLCELVEQRMRAASIKGLTKNWRES